MFRVFLFDKVLWSPWICIYLSMINGEYKYRVLFYSNVVLLPVSISVICVICWICPFHLNCLICWHKLLIRFYPDHLDAENVRACTSVSPLLLLTPTFFSPFLSYSNKIFVNFVDLLGMNLAHLTLCNTVSLYFITTPSLFSPLTSDFDLIFSNFLYS